MSGSSKATDLPSAMVCIISHSNSETETKKLAATIIAADAVLNYRIGSLKRDSKIDRVAMLKLIEDTECIVMHSIEAAFEIEKNGQNATCQECLYKLRNKILSIRL